MEANLNRASLKFPFVPELDGIRAIAVTIVFLSHAGLGRVVPGGLGVTIFFFLSGYLITSLLRSEAALSGRIHYGQFYIRRTLRIFPPLYITLGVIGLAVMTGVLNLQLDARTVWSQIFFVSNYSKLFDVGPGLPGPPLWSLAVEEHFYLVFPWLFGLVLMKMPAPRAAAICLALCAVPLAFRLYHGVYGDVTLNYFLSHTRIDSILFGCVLALWNNPVLDGERAWHPSTPVMLVGAAAILGAALVRDEFFGDTWRYTIQGLGMLLVFSWALKTTNPARKILTIPIMQLIGRYSYSLYLIHGFVILILKTHVPGIRIWELCAAAAVVSMVYSAAMYTLVERPLGQLRRRLHKENAGTETVEPSPIATPAPVTP